MTTIHPSSLCFGSGHSDPIPNNRLEQYFRRLEAERREAAGRRHDVSSDDPAPAFSAEPSILSSIQDDFAGRDDLNPQDIRTFRSRSPQSEPNGLNFLGASLFGIAAILGLLNYHSIKGAVSNALKNVAPAETREARIPSPEKFDLPGSIEDISR